MGECNARRIPPLTPGNIDVMPRPRNIRGQLKELDDRERCPAGRYRLDGSNAADQNRRPKYATNRHPVAATCASSPSAPVKSLTVAVEPTIDTTTPTARSGVTLRCVWSRHPTLSTTKASRSSVLKYHVQQDGADFERQKGLEAYAGRPENPTGQHPRLNVRYCLPRAWGVRTGTNPQEQQQHAAQQRARLTPAAVDSTALPNWTWDLQERRRGCQTV